ncbi:MAG: rhodanese [Tenericutes bacterium HGW-Tenericutes-4]|nr:MAG: rhodanese [Tenericutes bacterium HGW-Tenericutes-4]
MINVNTISVHELHKKLNTVNIIEIRESCEINGGKILTSEIILSIGLYLNHSFLLDRKKEYYVLTVSNLQSHKPIAFLLEQGYNITYVDGGTQEYSKHYLLEFVKKSSC